MRVDPEVAYQTLFQFVCGIANPQAGVASPTPLQTMSRRWQHWDKVGSDAMPAFYQLQPPDAIAEDQRTSFGLTRYKLSAHLYFYFAVDVNDKDIVVSTTLNRYFAALDKLFQPTVNSPGGARQQISLGPGIENVWVDGKNVIYDEGLTQPPAILMLPVTMLCGA